MLCNVFVYGIFSRLERTIFFQRRERVDASGTSRTKNVNMITDVYVCSEYIATARSSCFLRELQRVQIEKKRVAREENPILFLCDMPRKLNTQNII